MPSMHPLDECALERLCQTERKRTYLALDQLSARFSDYKAAYAAQGLKLAEVESALARGEREIGELRAQVATLIESNRLAENTERSIKGIKAAEETNVALREKQHELMMQAMSERLRLAENKQQNEQALYEIRERKLGAELKARAKRIEQLQKTIQNLTKVRKSEEQTQKLEVKASRTKAKSALERATKATVQMEDLRKRAEDAEAAVAKAEEQISDRDVALQKIADLLRAERERNTALQDEMVRAVAMFDGRLKEVTSSFMETLKEERHWRSTALSNIGRLNNVVERKAGWLDVMSLLVTPPLKEMKACKTAAAAPAAQEAPEGSM